MAMMILIIAVPLLAGLLAALAMAGMDSRRAGKDARPLIIAGRVVAALVMIGVVAILWVVRGSLEELEGGLLLISIILLLVMMVSAAWRPAVQAPLGGAMMATVAVTFILSRYNDGGWAGLLRAGLIFGSVALAAFVLVVIAGRIVRARERRKTPTSISAGEIS
ncbi:hypothetical protein [Brevundimonas sp.]|uniref:hypothetical protein n=1 Tax=Brevundimonas sp. TaxID=1871086 RepID=UPI002D34AF06|nr:hypothetical protein [Brevundimonas sp.]HYC96329.1 hypothetical protein [Brevundimonas sp.]